MSLSTLGDILTFVRENYKESDTSLNTVITGWVNKNLLRRQEMAGWRNSVVTGTTFACSAGVTTYATSSNFLRLVPNSVRYGVTSDDPGKPIPELTGEQYQYYRGAQSTSDPAFVTVIGASTGSGKVLKLSPPFTNSSSVVTYDYVRTPTSLSATTDALNCIELGEVVAYDTLVDLAVYHKDSDGAALYREQAKQSWRGAFQSLNPTGLA
jgi:hypothetical protein